GGFFSQIHLGPYAVQFIQGVFYTNGTVAAGHTIYGQHCGIGVVRFIPIRNAAFDWPHCAGTAAPAPPQGFTIPPDAKAAHRQGQPDKNNFHWVPPQADKSIIPTATGRSGSEAPPCAGTGRSPPSAPAESLAAPPFRPSAPRCDPPRPRCASDGR